MNDITQKLVHSLSVKVLASAIGLIALIVTATIASLEYFQTRASATAEHDYIVEYSERGRLESDRDLVRLELRYYYRLLDMGELSESERQRIRYLQTRLQSIEARLLELAQSNRG